MVPQIRKPRTNRWSTSNQPLAFFVLSENRPDESSSIIRATGTRNSGTNHPVGLVPPRRTAVRRPTPSRSVIFSNDLTKNDESKTRTYRERLQSSSTRRGDGSRRGRAGQDAYGSGFLGYNRLPYPPRRRTHLP